MLFFFYGTLLDGSDNPVAQDVHRLLDRVGDATTRGDLFAIPDVMGWFPGLVAGPGTVHGALYRPRISFTPADLARLDAYEDCEPTQPSRSLYRRVEREVLLSGNSSRVAQVYVFNRPLPPGSLAIAGGSFRSWLAKQNATAFTGLREAD